MPYQLAALGAAMMWAFGSLIAADPARQLGGARFTRIRMVFVTVILAAITTVIGAWSISTSDLFLLGLSALAGLVIGDVALFTAFARIGPRRTSVLFTLNAPVALVIGVVVFSESLTWLALLGAVATIVGVTMAVAYGTARGDTSELERVDGSLKAGIAWSVVGATGQAIGLALSKPVFEDADPIGAATWRVILATAVLWILARPADRLSRPSNRAPLTWRYVGILIVSGTIAMVLGMTLLLYAIGEGDVGVATILASTTPVLLLPLLWLVKKEAPPAMAWVGAGLTVIGAALLVA